MDPTEDPVASGLSRMHFAHDFSAIEKFEWLLGIPFCTILDRVPIPMTLPNQLYWGQSNWLPEFPWFSARVPWRLRKPRSWSCKCYPTIWWPKSGLGSYRWVMNSCETSTCVLNMNHHVWCFNLHFEGLEFHVCCLSPALENSMFLLVKPSVFVAWFLKPQFSVKPHSWVKYAKSIHIPWFPKSPGFVYKNPWHFGREQNPRVEASDAGFEPHLGAIGGNPKIAGVSHWNGD